MNSPEHGGIIFRFLSLLFFLAILGLLFTFRHPLMRFAGEMWVVSDTPVASDAIFVLGDDNYKGDRAAHAAELYREGLAPKVVASGRMLRPQAALADLMAQDLERDGVPTASIVKSSYETNSLAAESDSLKDLAMSKGWKRFLVVTSNYDTRRARLVLEHEFPRDDTIRVSAAADGDFNPTQWWHTSTGDRIFITALVSYFAVRVGYLER